MSFLYRFLSRLWGYLWGRGYRKVMTQCAKYFGPCVIWKLIRGEVITVWRISKYTWLGVLLSIFVHTPVLAVDLVYNTEEWTYYNYVSEGRITGTSTEVLRLISSAADVSYEIVLGPWDKSYNAALKEPGNCVFSTVLTKERFPLFKWVYPLEKTRLVLFKLKGSPLTATSFQDLKGKKIGSYKESVEVKLLRNQGLTVIEAPVDYVNIGKLRSGQIDAWATGEVSIKQAQEASIDIEEFFVISENDVGLACHRSTDDAIIAKLQAALDEMMKSGELEKIWRTKF